MELQILDSKTKQKLCTLERISSNTTIDSIKEIYQRKFPNYYPERQSFKSSPKGKLLKGSETLSELNLGAEGVLYFKDLGPQVGWSTVFYCEYTGPLFVYLLFYFRLPYIYDSKFAFTSSPDDVVHLAAICHSFHYMKRVLETKFVHRFSHGTMPIKNLFRNCSYYWSFAAWMAYYINHPLYTPATFGTMQICSGLAVFVLCELGNLSIHLAFRSLRPSGSKQRKIPTATGNPFTLLFNFVSCPNYTYEFGSWVGFAVMTQTLPVFIFAFVGFGQMAIWALAKHRNYKKEFSNYPRSRKAILPIVL
uniref:Trans-2,3-enoyl-CoA reductase-like n=1 Tax=Phallusia mammillata TaxID=59560 RepID=A0A6F9DV31_9ASCI|nr:very-long-chain enoyl-CoA reductase-like [Phallusia mammillata]